MLHLFYRVDVAVDREAVLTAVDDARLAGDQVVVAVLLGHKADVAFMALGEDFWRLRRLQTALAATGLTLVDSYASLTEVSEYAQGAPEQMKQSRLFPCLPPEQKPVFCFYPMSKRRNAEQNWFTLPYERRSELMLEHGSTGRKFSGRVLQVVTGSTGLDDYEWGVTLFCVDPDALKEVVYAMRFDQASAVYAEFGRFYVGMVESVEQALAATIPGS